MNPRTEQLSRCHDVNSVWQKRHNTPSHRSYMFGMRANSRAREAACVVVYFATVVLIFFRAPLLFPVHFQIPYDLDGYHFPLSDYIAWSLRNYHALPWWNPFSYMGQPFLGNVNAAMFYPPTLASVLAGNTLFGRFPYYFLELQLVFHVLIAALGAYLLLRVMHMSVAASLSGGNIYALGAFFASQTQHLGGVSCAAWLPWVIVGLYRLEQRRDLKSAAWTGLALGCMILAGFPAAYLPVFIFGPLLYGCWLWQRHARLKSHLQCRPALLLAASFALGIMLSAVSWLPAYQVAKQSVAEQRPIVQALNGIYPEALTSFFWPNLFGQLQRVTFHSRENPTFLHLYQGIPALVLVLGGASWLVRCRKARPFIVAAIFGLLWMLGTLTFVSQLMYLVFPPSVRRGIYPHYVLAYFCLFFAVLAAIVINGNEQGEGPIGISEHSCYRAAALAAVVALLFAGIGNLTTFALQTAASSATLLWVSAVLAATGLLTSRLNGSDIMRRRHINFALCVLIAVDLITVGSSNVLNTGAPREGIPDAVRFVREKLGPLRFYRADTTGLWSTWQTRVAEWRLPSANGMDPLLLRDIVTYRTPFSNVSGRQFSLKSPESPLLDLAGIRYIITPAKDLAGTKLIYHGEVNVFENPRAFPRFFLVGSVVPASDVTTAVAMIDRGEIDPARVAIVPLQDLGNFSGLSKPAARDELGSVKLVSYSPNGFTVQVEARRPAALIATETFWKDWHATVDGIPETITRADGIFRAVLVPAGTHRITMFIVPMSLYVGAAISLGGLLTCLLFILLPVRRATARLRDSSLD